MRFDWDPKKAELNEKKHGFSFAEAITAFDDPLSLIVDDKKHSVAEERKWLIGNTDAGRLAVVVFTERAEIIRVISARPASRKEREIYDTIQRIPV
ncbi:MAG: BrnT family toxin [Deltaproteobacteria bacterium]|nr:BrnT family toxin [Deltaproteobacteria bacterium]